MTRSRYWMLFAIAVIAAVAVVGSLVTPTARVARAARGGSAPVLASSAVCPSVTGRPGGLLSTDMVVAHVTPGTAPRAAYTRVPAKGGAQPAVPITLNPAAVVHKRDPYGAVAIAAAGAGADGVVASQTALVPSGFGRGLSDLACAPPATDWWYVGPDGRVGFTDLLVLVNPSDSAANIALSFWSSRGVLNPPNTSGITVAAHSAQVRPISDFAPDIAGASVHVHANSGTVSASVVDVQTAPNKALGSDWIGPSAAPSRSAVVTGFMPGSTYDRLYLLNPGEADATVALRVLTPTKNFVPAGHQNVVVPAGHTVSVDLSSAIKGEAAAVSFSSDQPVSAAGLTAQRPTTGFQDLAWLPGQHQLGGPAGVANNAPLFGQKVSLVVTAPVTTARLRLATPSGATATVSIPAGRTENVDLLAALHVGPGGPGPLLLTPLDGPVYVVRTFYAMGSHGPLMAASAPVTLPRPTPLPPVVDDPRAALP